MRPFTRVIALAAVLIAGCAPTAVAQRHGAGHQHHAAEPGERALAELDAVRRATARYRDPAEARADGYARGRIGLDLPLMGEHWVNRDRLDEPVDLLRPAVLQYVDVGGFHVLVGVAYARRVEEGDPMPEGFAGDADVWHVHDFTGFGEGRIAMVHAWLWTPSPDGVFAGRNAALPYIRAGLPPEWAAPGGDASARGIALLMPGACRRLAALGGRRAGPERRDELLEACDAASLRIAVSLSDGMQGDALNEVAAGAWAQFVESARGVAAPDGPVQLWRGSAR